MKNWQCRECQKYFMPNHMLTNEICVFCWFNAKIWRGKTKKECEVSGVNIRAIKRDAE